MSNEATFPEFASRPKIHRLPLHLAPSVNYSDRLFIMRALWACAGVIALAVAGIIYQVRDKTEGLRVVETVQAAPEDEFSRSSIYIKGKEGIIVGQMAKIPQEPEKVTDLKNISTIDQPAGRDLLAIISKY